MRASGGIKGLIFFAWVIHYVGGASVGVQELETELPDSPLREACANAFDYQDPVCLGNSTLYWGSGNGTDLSCAHCLCDDGFAGVDCGRCLDVSVCPDKIIDGKVVSATNCSSETLLLTEEEARSFEGKVFSCSCGGGEDVWTNFLCDQQPDTWIQFAVTGGGTEEDHALITVKEYAGIHARTEETWPDQYKYHYPKIFDGLAGPCKVYRDKCLPVQGTDVGERMCIIFDCGTTSGKCPPEEYPMCDGFPHCHAPSGQKYEVHPCTAVPESDKSITIACQEEKVNGSYVCYYQQPGAFAPLSMTCSVGSCLYEGGAPVQPSGSRAKRVAWTIGAQMAILVSLAGILLMCFLLFAAASDPGSAAAASSFMGGKSKTRLAAATATTRINNPPPPSKPSRGACGAGEMSVGNAPGDVGDQDLTEPLLTRDDHSAERFVDRTPTPAKWTALSGDVPRGASVTSAQQLQPRHGRHGGIAVVAHSDSSGRVCSDASVHTIGLDGGNGEEGEGLAQQQQQRVPILPKRPAVLRWSKLSYYVDAPGHSETLAEMTVLKGVSGFAGPEPAAADEPDRNAPSSNQDGASNVQVNQTGSVQGNSPGNDSGNGSGPSACSSNIGIACSSPDLPSTMTGILGPSGAGKSSLLDLLAGRKRKGEGRTSGWLSLALGGSGRARGGDGGGSAAVGAEAVRRVAGYVPQEDVLPGTLSCYEHLMFHARLRMPSGASYEERRTRVLWVIEELGLSRVADSRIGDELARGLSGGERRRLSIAAELVARPALLFLDEPTTGLDAATALRVMKLLRGVASRGTTVLCSLHQPRPRVLNLLDKVILLSRGQVAYFGAPSDAARYFSSVGRPFPVGQSHPADAMLALACQENGGDLPALFRRSPMASAASTAAAATVSAAVSPVVAVVPGRGEVDIVENNYPEESGRPAGGHVDAHGRGVQTELVEVGGRRRNSTARGRNGMGWRTSRDGGERGSLVSSGGGVGEGDGGRSRASGADLMAGESSVTRNGGGGMDAWEEGQPSAVPFLVQVEVLSRRLLLRAIRHPLLLFLHIYGSVAMALCLGSVFGGHLEFNLAGAQNRFGALFFLLLYLSLLSLTSLPVWREDRRLFLTESMGGAYGHLPYFTSVALADILLIRVIPPLVFAVLAYPLMGLNSAPDNNWCLLWFAGILVVTNVTVALGAMGVGALGLPLDLSNLVGGLMVLLLAAFGRFLLNGTRIPWAWRWLSSVTPLGYAFEALLINEFSDKGGIRPYRIEGSHCSPDLPVIEPLGPEILVTFSFAPDVWTMRVDVAVLVCLALGLWVVSLLIFFFATRTKPLLVGTVSARVSTARRSHSSSSQGSRGRLKHPPSNATSIITDSNGSMNSSAGTRMTRRSTDGRGDRMVAPNNGESSSLHSTTNTATDTAQQERRRRPSRHVEFGATTTRKFREYSGDDSEMTSMTPGQRNGGHRVSLDDRAGGSNRRLLDDRPARSPAPVPLLLSWEGLRYVIPAPKKKRWSWLSLSKPAHVGSGENVPLPATPVSESSPRWMMTNGGAGGVRRGSPVEDAASSPRLDSDDTTNVLASAGCSKKVAESDRLVILDNITGFAGPCGAQPDQQQRQRTGVDRSGEEKGQDESHAITPAAVTISNGELQADGEAALSGDHGTRRSTRTVHTGGTVTAIMGPSGAGKTSLLNALAGRLPQRRTRRHNEPAVVDGSGTGGSCSGMVGLTGSVRLNGVEVTSEEVVRVSAYVTQEDVLPETLTCYEHLMFHARLRLPQGTSLGRRRARVVEVLRELGLFGVRDSRIGGGLSRGISGGEKRRLSIGTELLTRPPLLFLDEPTTGLDSSTALRVMSLLSRVASRGTTILCSLHQPRPQVVDLLDKVILLSRGGVAFSGAPREAEAFFAATGRPFPGTVPPDTAANSASLSSAGMTTTRTVEDVVDVNPADAMLDAVGDAENEADRRGVARGVGHGASADVAVEEGIAGRGKSRPLVFPAEVAMAQVRAAEASCTSTRSLVGINSAASLRTPPPLAVQLDALLRRAALNVGRDPYLAWLHVLLTVCVGLVVGSLFRDLGRLNEVTAGVQDRLGVMFLLLLYLSLLCLTSLAAWRKQMSLFLHERASGAYGALAHLSSAAAVDALACRIAPPFLLALTVRPLAGLREGSLPGLTVGLVVFNLSLAAVLAACGAGARSSQEALAMGCLVVLFSALLSGFLVSTDDLPSAWRVLAWVSPIGRGFEALAANEFSPYGAVFRLSTKIGAVTAKTPKMTGEAVLHCFGFDGGRYATDLGIIAAVGACGLVVAFLLLKRSR